MNDGEPKREKDTELFLGRKRNLDILQNNYLFRRFLSPGVENDYETISNLYYLLMSFDWNDDKYSKNSIIQNIRGYSFWFYLCSTYFPFYSNELLDKKDSLPDALRKFVIDSQAQAKNSPKKTSLTSKKDKFIKDLLSLTKGGGSIANEISSIEKSIHLISIINNNKLNGQIKKDYILTDRPDVRYYGKPELRMDIEYHSKALKKFVEYIKNQNETKNTITQQEEKDPDDVECVICNDGDYENDNLIVYCSLCHITVHQKCYGILKVPEEDWVCHSCLIYGPNNKQQCILCPVLGGAMKTCSLKKTSNFYNFIMTSRSENSANQLNALEEKSEKQKVLFSVNKTVNKTLDETPIQSQSTPKKKKKGDCESENTATNTRTNKNINDKIANDHAWVHMSCALWISEISINNYEEKEEIKGVESIGKKRYGDSCGICLLKGFGPTVKCERCELSFHVECARKNHYTLESTDNQMGENKFHIFCLRHAPHKLIKSRELRKQREIDDIIQFSNILNKNIENYNKTHKKNPISVCLRGKGHKKIEMSNKFKLNLIERKKFINAIRQLAIDISSLSIKVIRSNQLEHNGNSNTIYSIKIDDKIKMSYNDLLAPSKFPWYILKETEPYLKGLLPIEIFKIFKVVIPNEFEYSRVILKKNIKKEKHSSSTVNQKKQVIHQTQMTYCYCHKNGDAPFMVGCENGEDCANNGWYHQECVEELKELSRAEIQSESFTFTCFECKKKLSSNNNMASNSNDALLTCNSLSNNSITTINH